MKRRALPLALGDTPVQKLMPPAAPGQTAYTTRQLVSFYDVTVPTIRYWQRTGLAFGCIDTAIGLVRACRAQDLACFIASRGGTIPTFKNLLEKMRHER